MTDFTLPPGWQVGDHDHRWRSYLQPDSEVLQNKVGATTHETLRLIEDRLVEARLLTLVSPDGPRITYDLAGLQGIHRWLFQDVYKWAGESRTVNMSKNGVQFLSWQEIDVALEQFADLVTGTDRLRSIDETRWPEAISVAYLTLNAAHPFREGNGRAQRVLLDVLAAESGHALDWMMVQGARNDEVSREALLGDPGPLIEMITNITRDLTPDETPHQQAETPSLYGSYDYGYAPRQPGSPARSHPGTSIRAGRSS